MSTLKTPFKYDFVGSFLRPQALKDAKAKFADGEISKDEMQDFIAIKNQLDKISLSVNTLQLWIDKTIADGKIDPKLLEYFNK